MTADTDTNNTIATGNALMDLRLVILKTIASVWEDDEKHQQKRSESLRHQLINKSPNEIICYFRETFGYKMPFDNFGIKFIKGSAVWDYYGDNEWKKPLFETITLVLPNCEKEWHPYEQASYLMDYYTHFPTFFGLNSPINSQENHGKDPIKESKATLTMNDAVPKSFRQPERDMSGNDYHLGVSGDPFLSFGAVMNKLIAAAWCSREFKKSIDYDAHTKRIKSEKENLYKDKRQVDQIYFDHIKFILMEHYSFEIPWAFHLKLKFAKKYNPEQDHNNSAPDPRLSFRIKDEDKWKWRSNPTDCDATNRIIRNTVSLEIPIAPDSKNANISLALARYNAIGPAYPFTCS